MWMACEHRREIRQALGKLESMEPTNVPHAEPQHHHLHSSRNVRGRNIYLLYDTCFCFLPTELRSSYATDMMDEHGTDAVSEAGPGHEAEYVGPGGSAFVNTPNLVRHAAVMVTRIALVAGNEEQESHRAKRGHGVYYISKYRSAKAT